MMSSGRRAISQQPTKGSSRQLLLTSSSQLIENNGDPNSTWLSSEQLNAGASSMGSEQLDMSSQVKSEKSVNLGSADGYQLMGNASEVESNGGKRGATRSAKASKLQIENEEWNLFLKSISSTVAQYQSD